MDNNIAPRRRPVWLLIVCVLFLLWNLFGLAVFALGMLVLNNDGALRDAGLNDAQVELVLSTPMWVNIAFGAAVIFGVLGSAVLLAGKKIAIPILGISLLGVLAQNFYVYFLSDSIKIMGVGASPLVILGSIAVIPFSIWCARRGWLL